jgi:anaerobic magnesium-protoporphyrin IX monomethyl ester cyclase
MTEILLVSPPTPSPAEQAGYSTMSPPLGLGYVAASLREDGFSTALLDLGLSEDPFGDLEAAMLAHSPRIVGFSPSTQASYAAEGLARYTRECDPQVLLWVGGPHVSYEWRWALEESRFDVVFFFEAERSAVEAARCQLRGQGALEDVAGIALLRDGLPVRTAPRPREKVLDTIPFPARDLMELHRYTRPGTIMSSRGCPLKCIFCIASTFEDAYRPRSPDNVVAELRHIHEVWGVQDFYFVDNVFTTVRARARAICELIRDSGLPIGFYCVSRVDYVTPVLMQDLASAGCYRIELGVESVDPGILATMRKRIKPEQVWRAADIILNLGMQPMFTFQVGHPDDTLDTIEETLEVMAKLRAMGAGTYLSVTTPFPGTPLMINREAYGIRIETWDWEDFRWSNPTYSTRNVSRNDIRHAVFRDAVAQAAFVASGAFRDPPAAPWIRFAAGNEVALPPPPAEPEAGAQPVRTATDDQVSLPLRTVAR